MEFKNIEELRNDGFVGFIRIGELFADSSPIPKTKGVYLILRLVDSTCDFLPIGIGGYFKGKNPNVALDVLKSKWINDTIVVYIGKAGKDGSRATLHSRLKQYFGFGQGGNVGHWGGRFIWQLKNCKNLVVCWKPLPKDDPRAVESKLIEEFTSKYGTRPFANLID